MPTIKKQNFTDGTDSIGIDAIILVAGKVLSSLALIIIFVVLSRSYTPEEYGTFRQIWMINKDLSIGIFAFGIPIGILYYLARLSERSKKQFIYQSLLLLLMLGSLASIVIYVGSGFIAAQFENPELKDSLTLFSFYPALALPTIALESVFISLGRTRAYAAFVVISKTIFIGVVAASAFLTLPLAALLKVILLFAVAELIVSLAMLRIFTRQLKGFSREISIKQQVFRSAPMGLGTVINILNTELDKVIVSLRFSVQEFSVYANGAVVIPFIGTVAGATSNVLMPHLVKHFQQGETVKLLDLWGGAIVRVAIIFYPLIAFLFVFAEEFVVALFSEKYANSSGIFQIYLVSQLPKIVYFSPLLMAIDKPKVPLTGAAIGLIVNIPLSWVLADIVGIEGPAVATIISVFLVAGIYMKEIGGHLHARVANVFPFMELVKILAISFAIALPLRALVTWFDVSLNIFAGLIISFILYLILCLAVLRWAGVVRPSDLEFIVRRLRMIAGRSWN